MVQVYVGFLISRITVRVYVSLFSTSQKMNTHNNIIADWSPVKRAPAYQQRKRRKHHPSISNNLSLLSPSLKLSVALSTKTNDPDIPKKVSPNKGDNEKQKWNDIYGDYEDEDDDDDDDDDDFHSAKESNEEAVKKCFPDQDKINKLKKGHFFPVSKSGRGRVPFTNRDDYSIMEAFASSYNNTNSKAKNAGVYNISKFKKDHIKRSAKFDFKTVVDEKTTVKFMNASKIYTHSTSRKRTRQKRVITNVNAF